MCKKKFTWSKMLEPPKYMYKVIGIDPVVISAILRSKNGPNRSKLPKFHFFGGSYRYMIKESRLI